MRVGAAPPLGGFRPIEQVVAGGCHGADSVARVRVSRLVVTPFEGGERGVATFEVVRVLRGRAADVPASWTYTRSIPLPTDAFPTRLEPGGEYVVFLSRANGFQTLQPTGPYADVPVDRVTALAEAACGGSP